MEWGCKDEAWNSKDEIEREYSRRRWIEWQKKWEKDDGGSCKKGLGQGRRVCNEDWRQAQGRKVSRNEEGEEERLNCNRIELVLGNDRLVFIKYGVYMVEKKIEKRFQKNAIKR